MQLKDLLGMTHASPSLDQLAVKIIGADLDAKPMHATRGRKP